MQFRAKVPISLVLAFVELGGPYCSETRSGGTWNSAPEENRWGPLPGSATPGASSADLGRLRTSLEVASVAVAKLGATRS